MPAQHKLSGSTESSVSTGALCRCTDPRADGSSGPLPSPRGAVAALERAGAQAEPGAVPTPFSLAPLNIFL